MRKQKRSDSELLDDEGELTLLNLEDHDREEEENKNAAAAAQEERKDVDDGIDRLDAEDEKPF